MWDGKQSIVGYTKQKQPQEENLNQIEDTDQLKGIYTHFPTLYLQTFLNFRLYREGQLIDKVQNARPYVIHKLGAIPPFEKEKEFFDLLGEFFFLSLASQNIYSKNPCSRACRRGQGFKKNRLLLKELKQKRGRRKEKAVSLFTIRPFRNFLFTTSQRGFCRPLQPKDNLIWAFARTNPRGRQLEQ